MHGVLVLCISTIKVSAWFVWLNLEMPTSLQTVVPIKLIIIVSTRHEACLGQDLLRLTARPYPRFAARTGADQFDRFWGPRMRRNHALECNFGGQS